MFVCLCQSFREKKILPYIRSKIKVVLSFVHNLHKGFLVFLLKECLTAYIYFIYLNKLYRNFFFFFNETALLLSKIFRWFHDDHNYVHIYNILYILMN